MLSQSAVAEYFLLIVQDVKGNLSSSFSAWLLHLILHAFNKCPVSGSYTIQLRQKQKNLHKKKKKANRMGLTNHEKRQVLWRAWKLSSDSLPTFLGSGCWCHLNQQDFALLSAQLGLSSSNSFCLT